MSFEYTSIRFIICAVLLVSSTFSQIAVPSIQRHRSVETDHVAQIHDAIPLPTDFLNEKSPYICLTHFQWKSLQKRLWNTVDGSEIWRLSVEGKVVEIYHYLPPVLAPSQTGGWLALGISEGWKNQPPTVESLHIPSRWGSRANSSGHGYAIDGWKVGDAQYRCPAMVFPRWMWTIENPSSGWKIHGMERPVDHQCGF